MTRSRVASRPAADVDVEAAFDWFEGERPGLGLEFLDELAATYERIADGPEKYQRVSRNVRRALLHRFPWAVYFAIEVDRSVVLAVLHVARDPAEWQRRVAGGAG